MSTPRILVATDGTTPVERACRTVVALLGYGQADVRLLTVLSYQVYPFALGDERATGGAEGYAERDAAVERAVAAAARVFEDAGFKAGVAHRYGNPADEILAEIDEWQPTLVVLGRRGVAGLERILGSVSERVIRHSRAPVMVSP